MNGQPPKQVSKPRILTPKQEAFCLNYISGLNGTQSVIKAGYDCEVSHTAESVASENLSKPEIVQRILELRERAAAANLLTLGERNKILDDIARKEKAKRPHVSIAAIAERNKVEHVYSEAISSVTNNTQINIYASEEGRKLTQDVAKRLE